MTTATNKCEKDSFSFSVHLPEQFQTKRFPLSDCHSHISHVYDPMYKCPWLDTQQQKYLVPSSFSSISFNLLPNDFRASDTAPVGTNSTGNVSLTSQSDSGISWSETAETRSTGPLQYALDCNKSPSASESDLTSLDKFDPNDVNYLLSSCSYIGDRPPSPDSNASFDEFTALTPNSQIPMFDSQSFDSLYLTDSSLVSLKGDPSSFLDAFPHENRPDSPDSLDFDSPKSYSNVPSDDTQ